MIRNLRKDFDKNFAFGGGISDSLLLRTVLANLPNVPVPKVSAK